MIQRTRVVCFSLLVTTALLLVQIILTSAVAHSDNKQLPEPPSGRNPGGRSRGGGSRWRIIGGGSGWRITEYRYRLGGVSRSSGCSNYNRREPEALVPVITDSVPRDHVPVVAVLSSSPTLWFSIPKTTTIFATAKFTLQNESGTNQLYSTKTTVRTPSIVGIPLPGPRPLLQPNKPYVWQFELGCGDTYDPSSIGGWIERITPDAQLSRKLKAAATPQQRLEVYVESGLWFDALDELARMRLKNPNDETLKAEWDDLLKSAGLDGTSRLPIFLVPVSK